MNLTFPAVLPRYHRSGVSFVARDGKRTVEFWMTASAFEERFGHRDLDADKAIGTFERNRNAIEHAAREAYRGQRRMIVLTAASFDSETQLPEVAVSDD